MLGLTRRVGERILIDDTTVLIVNKIGGGQVEVLFHAPTDVEIVRWELLNQERQQEHERKMAKAARAVSGR